MWDHCETFFDGKVEVLVNNAGLNPSAGWKLCLDVMLYGVMIGSFLARDRMGLSKVDVIFWECFVHWPRQALIVK